ncbi:MAG: hypothetical protein U0470_11785 [Anaerolineae bacterium]
MTDPMVPKYVAVLIVAFVFVVLVALWAVHPPDAEYRERMLRLAVTGQLDDVAGDVDGEALCRRGCRPGTGRPRRWSTAAGR